MIPPLENENNEIVTGNTQNADHMNDYYVSQARTDTTGLTLPSSLDNDQNHDGELPPTLEQLQVTENQVLKILDTLEVNKSTGPDKLPTKIIKLTSILMVESLTSLFNKSLVLEYFQICGRMRPLHQSSRKMAPNLA